ncbi:hypothetical protein BY996DRAFT_4587854 [Phakopsora pachyrhizi]|uniref:Uncharacterized protein n=1 Tax=Phakopsora pachyrhizi TaxID=170000 RepID=A0AAV0BNR0_PHAPC|nr:hypothetical protein BY996DRAFT_4587854 [Phakopsora pachyrhizi]CAH7687845.1 hypothetical protein PPACK8108_LOCUS22696 [Phakopsora pachyrhizi]
MVTQDQANNSASPQNNSPVDDSSSMSIITLEPPPSYAEARSSMDAGGMNLTEFHPFENTNFFPSGVFVLRNRSSLKALDVKGEGNQAGARVIGYTPKRPTLLDGTLLHKGNNQLFFLDWHGCLCAANCGLRVDVDENFGLVLSKPQPISPRPTRDSHPPPQFRYDPLTRTISVVFSHDPTFSNATLQEIASVEYLLELQPKSSLRHPATSSSPLEKLSKWLPINKLSVPINEGPSEAATIPDSRVELEDSELDDSPDLTRDICVVSVAPGWREKFPSSSSPEARKWLKRQWDIASIIVKPRHQSTCPVTSPSTRNSCLSDPNLPSSNVLDDLSQALGDLGSEISRVLRL